MVSANTDEGARFVKTQARLNVISCLLIGCPTPFCEATI